MKKKENKVSIRQIARAAGVSPMAVSFALNNQREVSPATRAHIMGIARELGYVPNARLSTLMAQVRRAATNDPLPIAWLNTADEKEAWHRYQFLSPLLEGASARALELGYRLEEHWCHEPGMTMRRLAKILYQRGIEGVIVTHPARRIRLNWDYLASVALGSSLLAPQLHRITGDFIFNFQLALKSLRRLGYRRIGVCLGQEVDSYSQNTIRATARDLFFGQSSKERIPPLFHAHQAYPGKTSEDLYEMRRKEMVRWLKHYKPEVIVGHDNHLKQWAEGAGYRVPEDVGLVHLAVDDDVLDWAGIHSRRRDVGAAAVDQLVSLMRNHQYGVPKIPLSIQIRGCWHMGRTVKQPVVRRGRKVVA